MQSLVAIDKDLLPRVEDIAAPCLHHLYRCLMDTNHKRKLELIAIVLVWEHKLEGVAGFNLKLLCLFLDSFLVTSYSALSYQDEGNETVLRVLGTFRLSKDPLCVSKHLYYYSIQSKLHMPAS